MIEWTAQMESSTKAAERRKPHEHEDPLTHGSPLGSWSRTYLAFLHAQAHVDAEHLQANRLSDGTCSMCILPAADDIGAWQTTASLSSFPGALQETGQ